MSIQRPHWETYSAQQRTAQLTMLTTICRELALLFGEHHDTWFADAYKDCADVAERLLQDGWDRAQLIDVATAIPSPDWMNPRYLDYNEPRDAWQDAAAALINQAESTATELRAIATLEN